MTMKLILSCSVFKVFLFAFIVVLPVIQATTVIPKTAFNSVADLRNTSTIFILGAQITMEVSINNFKLTFLVRLQLFWLLLTRWSHGEGQCEYCVRSIDTQSHTNFKPCSSYQQRQPSSRYSLRKVSSYNYGWNTVRKLCCFAAHVFHSARHSKAFNVRMIALRLTSIARHS